MSEHNLPIDISLLESATEGDKDLQKEVLDLFVSQLPQYLDAIQRHEGEALKAAAHRLRGAALSIGATPIALMASSLEQGTYVGTKADAVSLLKTELKRLKASVLVL